MLTIVAVIGMIAIQVIGDRERAKIKARAKA